MEGGTNAYLHAHLVGSTLWLTFYTDSILQLHTNSPIPPPTLWQNTFRGPTLVFFLHAAGSKVKAKRLRAQPEKTIRTWKCYTNRTGGDQGARNTPKRKCTSQSHKLWGTRTPGTYPLRKSQDSITHFRAQFYYFIHFLPPPQKKTWGEGAQKHLTTCPKMNFSYYSNVLA